MTREAFENAIMVDMAMGGSTNTVLHIPAVAREAGIEITLDLFDEISRKTSNLCSIIPAGEYEMADIDLAGGIPAVMNRLEHRLNDCPTVNGLSIKDIAKKGRVLNEDVIRTPENAYHAEGGIAVLKGNLAVSSVIKQTAVQKEMLVHSGPAKVFFSEKELMDALGEKKISEGDIVVLPFQGPAGAPGMPEMLTPTDAIKGAGYKRVALVTDGRFSGATTGPCIGHVEPEAYNGGAIGIVRDGDMIDINIPKRSLSARITADEIQSRLRHMKVPERTLTPLLRSFREKFSNPR
jgi:dihydroxy-acid dehydratase